MTFKQKMAKAKSSLDIVNERHTILCSESLESISSWKCSRNSLKTKIIYCR